MEWYEILIAFFALSCVMGALVIISLFDYKYKLRKLEFDERKENKLILSLDQIVFTLNEINNNIYIKNKE